MLTALARLVKNQFRASAFTCRLRSCPRATVGFENDSLRREHEITHVGGYRCTVVNCQYPPFHSAKSLRNHTSNVHNPDPVSKSIRRVGQLNGLIRAPKTRVNVTKQPSTGQNGPGNAFFGVQTNSNVPMARKQHNHNQVDNGSAPVYGGNGKDSNFKDPSWASQDESTLQEVEGVEPKMLVSYAVELEHLEHELDQVFQHENYDGAWQQLEPTLKSFQLTGAVISPENRVMLIPPGIPNHARQHLLELPQIVFLRILYQTCIRARKNKEENEKRRLSSYGFDDFIKVPDESIAFPTQNSGARNDKQPSLDSNDPRAFSQLSEDPSFDNLGLGFDNPNAHELSSILTGFIRQRQRQEPDLILHAQKLLQQNLLVAYTTDDTNFVLNERDRYGPLSGLPSDINTWSQLKQFVRQNSWIFPSDTLQKLAELQVIQYLGLTSQPDNWKDASEYRESGSLRPQEAPQGFLGAYVKPDCEECRRQNKKCNMSRPCKQFQNTTTKS